MSKTVSGNISAVIFCKFLYPSNINPNSYTHL